MAFKRGVPWPQELVGCGTPAVVDHLARSRMKLGDAARYGQHRHDRLTPSPSLCATYEHRLITAREWCLRVFGIVKDDSEGTNEWLRQ
jgi:hypothetical protein